MAKGNRTGYKRNIRNKVQLKERGSDESDEDYNVSEDEVFDESEDEYCSSLADDESEECVGQFEEEEEDEWLDHKAKKAGKPQLRKGPFGRKKNGVTRPRKKSVSYNDDDDDDDEDDFDDVEFTTVKQKEKNKLSLKEEEDDDYEDAGFIPVKQGKKNKLSLKAEEEEDYENVDFTTIKKNMPAPKEEEDDDFEDFCLHEETDILDTKSRIPRAHSHGTGSEKKPRKKTRVSYREAEEDSDFETKPRTNATASYGEALEDSDFDDSENKPRRKGRVSYREALEDSDYDDSENKPRTKTRGSYREPEEFSDYDDAENKPRTKTRGSYREAEEYSDCDDAEKKPRTKAGVSYCEAGEESDYDDSNDDDDDVEFTPDEVDALDDEEELPVTKSRVVRPRVQEARITKGFRRKRTLKGTKRKRPVKEQVARKKRSSDPDEEFVDNESLTWKKTKVTRQGRGRRKSCVVNSDSDFVSSGRSDCEFTISEEEREQVKEASEFCKRLSCSLRSSGPLNLIEKEETAPPERKRPLRKGKEKVTELKIEVGKPVCGICLSEEGKRTVRGILNCCNHYFCFACIMEWSKVESRCPLCKQRFTAISRTSRADGGHDLRDAVMIAVPERDQVYQPSEEELRGYLDPYENVLCTECQQGGDDAHMLLCDLCDSPAHTYCVGLGQEVPEGNWYCDGCRPTILASQSQTPTTDRVSTNPFGGCSSPVPSSVRETFDLNEMYVPETPLSQVPEPSPLPRHPTGDSQVFSPTYGSGLFTYGSGAFTLFDRRRIQRQIHQMLNNRSRQPDRSDALASVPSTTLFGSQIVQGVSLAPHNTSMPMGAAPQSMFQQGRVPDRGTTFMYSREGLSPRFSNLRGQALRDQSSASMVHDFIGFPHNEFSGVDSRIGEGVGHHQLQPCSSSRSNTGVGTSISPFQFQEATVPSRTWQGSLHPPF